MTVDEYYLKQVQFILDSAMQQLVDNPGVCAYARGVCACACVSVRVRRASECVCVL